MFSALKRLTGNKENNANNTPPGLQAMSHNLQRKFAKGVQYNMKIIIKGDRNTGKTCLFERLQGKAFVQEYIPTEEIQVASIQWSYKTTDDIVKVEIWDVVDKGRKRQPLEGLKLGEETAPAVALDAEFLDVYKGTHGVILVMDITKNWTFDYIQKEMSKVPDHIPVLVLGNHCDMSHHRTVTKDMVSFYIDSVQRPKSKGQIRYSEASMSNGFGLKYLHKYFCIPFLQLQREALLGQLERNGRETHITLQELDLFQQDSDYDTFLTGLSEKRRQVADSTSNVQSSVGPLPVGQGVGIPKSASAPKALSQTSSIASTILIDKINNGLVGVLDNSVTSVDEFVPDGGVIDKSFLEEGSPPSSAVPQSRPPDSDSEGSEAGNNPLVSGYQDDLDPDDSLHSAPPLPIFETTTPQNSEAVDELTNWLSRLEDRGSPEGGEDSQDNLDNGLNGVDANANACTIISNSNITSPPKPPKMEKSSKHKQKHKKKSIKAKEAGEEPKEEQRRRRKKSSKKDEKDALEDFLNSQDLSYEAI